MRPAHSDSQNPATGAVQRLVAPLAWDRFLSDHWGRELAYIPGAQGRFDSLFGWDELSAILAGENFPLDDLKFYLDGTPLEQTRYVRRWRGRTTLKPGTMAQLASEGATLILDNVHRLAPAVRSLALECERVFGAETTVNLYAGWRTRPGFGLHWDPQDTIILQLSGQKAWNVFGPTRPHPRRDDIEMPGKPSCAPVWDGVLRDGDALYLPRGWWHAAQAMDEPSLHLTVTIVPPAGPDLLAWIGERLMRHADFRKDLPAMESAAKQAAYVSGFRQMVLATLDDDVLQQFLAQWRSRLPIAPRFELPEAVARARAELEENSRVRLTANACLAFAAEEDGKVSFRANEVLWHCAPALVPALAMLRADQSIAVRALGEVLATPADLKALKTFLTVLAMGGALWVDASSPSGA